MKSELAKAIDEWLQSDEGKKLCQDSAAGQYLKNRLRVAFIAGWDACGNTCKQSSKR